MIFYHQVFRTLIEELERRSKLPAGLSLKMFANIGEIYKLHTQELLPQLILRVQQRYSSDPSTRCTFNYITKYKLELSLTELLVALV